MESSRRAVETYWRSRTIDGATSDEDKVTPVYKLEEICELLRSSHVSIVKEVSEFILKRLEHKSPIVKQKALRLIKYAVVKSGAEFRREMQRNSVAVRQLLHYKGQPDPLKGDALNKAVRDTAQEAITAIFSTEDSKPQPAGHYTKRMEGFGNTSSEMPSGDKRSLLSEVVGIGSATIKQGFSNLTQAQSSRKNDSGSYRSPNLRRSLNTEGGYPDRHEKFETQDGTSEGSRFSGNVTTGPWGQDLKVPHSETTDGGSSLSHAESKTREERLLETIVTSGGVRLQPSRDALQVFLVEASKLDAMALSHALDSKLQSPQWQVRMKAICVLEAILRKKEDEHFSIIASYFSEMRDVVVRCSESPQASLREKANKVLGLLNGEHSGTRVNHPGRPVMETSIEMPDLIDTGDPEDLFGAEDSTKVQRDQNIANPMTSTTDLIGDLLGDTSVSGVSTSEQKNDDPFADVSFHTSNDKEPVTDLFSGMTFDEAENSEVHIATNKNGPEHFDIFGSNSEVPQEQRIPRENMNDLMAGLSISQDAPVVKQTKVPPGSQSETIFANSTINGSSQVSNDVLKGMLDSPAAGMNANFMSPTAMGPLPYNPSAGMMFNPAFPSQPLNYGAMGNLFTQQQLFAAMSNFQLLGTLQAQNAGVYRGADTNIEGSFSPLPDIFNPNIPAQTTSSAINASKKEETKAFDFISDHLAAARDPKRVL